MRESTSNLPSAPSVTNGSLTTCWWTLFGKYASSVRPLIVHWPVPGTMRTRALASLRRPGPPPRPVIIGRRVTRLAGPASADSVVYSDGASSSEMSFPAGYSLSKYSAASADAASIPVGSATLLFLTLPCGARPPDILRACSSDRHPGYGGRTPDDYCEICRISYGCGCCAWCGGSGPAYTLSLVSVLRPSVFLGSIPLPAFSTARSGCLSLSPPQLIELRPTW